MSKPNTEKDAAKMRDMVAQFRTERAAREAAEPLEPAPDLMAPLTSLESLALLRCRFQTVHGKDERGHDVKSDVRDVEEMKTLLSIVESATAPPDPDLDGSEREERAERLASALVTAYIWARIKQSVQGGAALDLRAMGAASSPEFRRVLRQLERQKTSERAGAID